MVRESIDVATGAFGSLLYKLEQLLQDEFKHNLPKSAKHDIRYVSMELQSIHSFLRNVTDSHAEHQPEPHIRLWELDARELSYDMEDAIDTILVRLKGLESTEPSSTMSRLMKIKVRRAHKVFDEIKDIKQRINKVRERFHRYRIDDHLHKPRVSTIDPRLRMHAHLHGDQHSLVGIDEAADYLIGRLALEGDMSERRLKTVSIVGMGGLGKTTLANVVYDRLKAQFECAAFVSVSRDPDMKKVFGDMFYQLDEEKYNNIHSAHKDDEIQQLIDASRDFLQNKRYFIVVDDIWSRKAWDMIRSALLENNYGSRVITTTRIFEVASGASDFYRMRPLSHENSKRLLCKRIFNSASVELLEVGDKLLKKYDGLPLAVLTIAGIPVEQWYDVYDTIACGHVNDRVMDHMIHILSFSYYDLPSYLKTCLLYLSIFPEDYLIKKDFLIWRWIAEGFIWKDDRHGSLFELGESYFEELINRCLIQPAETGDNKGSVDGCRVHGAVLDLLRYLAREENFVTLLIEKEQNISLGRAQPRRLALQKGNNEDHTLQIDISLAKVRSFNASMCSANMMPLLSGFRFLRVLSLEHCPSIKSYHLKYVGKLFLLRYIGLAGTPISELPDGIGELEFLETLDLRETGIQELPRTVCRLRKLMCLCVDSTARLPRGIGNLVDLEDLRLYSVMTLHFVKEELGQLRALRILEIRFEELDEQMEEAFLRSLSNLQKLQTLVVDVFVGSSNFDRMAELFFVPPPRLWRFKAVTMTRSTALPARIGSLSALSHVSIEATELRQGDLKILGGLPVLRSLWISSRSNERPLVITVEDGFTCLRVFTLWNGALGPDFQRGAMPKVARVEFGFSLRDARSADFGFGLGNLLSLEHATVHLHGYYKKSDDDKVHNVEAALRHVTNMHPGRPIITVIRDSEESTDTTAASTDTITQKDLAEMQAKQLEERRNKFIQELQEENLLLDKLQAQLMDIRA